jgi:chromate transporter
MASTEFSTPARVPPPAPASILILFLAFNRLALQGFGGVLPVAQRELVERLGWISQEDFVELLAMGQVLPGPNIVNMSLMIGDRFFGWRGAAAAMAGMLLVPSFVVLGLAVLYGQLSRQPVAVGALRGMGVVAAGLIVATGLKLLPSLKRNVLGRPLCLALALLTFVAIALLRLPLIWVLLALGGLGMLVAWSKLKAVGP